MFDGITREEYQEALERTAEDLLWEAGVEPGPVDAFEVAERLGVAVVQDNQLSQRGQFVRLSEQSGATQATVLLGREQRAERQQWALAHELGEAVAYRVFERLGVELADVQRGSREQVASQLASRLLLPFRQFRKVGVATDWDLWELKSAFPTASHELIARRLLDLRQPFVVTVVDRESISWRRANVQGVPSQMIEDELDCWRECHSLAEPICHPRQEDGIGSATIRCWPVHEPGWQREIVTMQLDDAA